VKHLCVGWHSNLTGASISPIEHGPHVTAYLGLRRVHRTTLALLQQEVTVSGSATDLAQCSIRVLTTHKGIAGQGGHMQMAGVVLCNAAGKGKAS
jgi:hypothetical protein